MGFTLKGLGLGNRKGQGAQVGGSQAQEELCLSPSVHPSAQSPLLEGSRPDGAGPLWPRTGPCPPPSLLEIGRQCPDMVHLLATWPWASTSTSLTFKFSFWKQTQRCLPAGLMHVKFRPAGANKGVNIQAGGPRLASCPSSQEPRPLSCRGTRKQLMRESPAPPHSAPGQRGRRQGCCSVSLWDKGPSLLRSRTHSMQHPVQTKLD